MFDRDRVRDGGIELGDTEAGRGRGDHGPGRSDRQRRGRRRGRRGHGDHQRRVLLRGDRADVVRNARCGNCPAADQRASGPVGGRTVRVADVDAVGAATIDGERELAGRGIERQLCTDDVRPASDVDEVDPGGAGHHGRGPSPRVLTNRRTPDRRQRRESHRDVVGRCTGVDRLARVGPHGVAGRAGGQHVWHQIGRDQAEVVDARRSHRRRPRREHARLAGRVAEAHRGIGDEVVGITDGRCRSDDGDRHRHVERLVRDVDHHVVTVGDDDVAHWFAGGCSVEAGCCSDVRERDPVRTCREDREVVCRTDARRAFDEVLLIG